MMKRSSTTFLTNAKRLRTWAKERFHSILVAASWTWSSAAALAQRTTNLNRVLPVFLELGGEDNSCGQVKTQRRVGRQGTEHLRVQLGLLAFSGHTGVFERDFKNGTRRVGDWFRCIECAKAQGGGPVLAEAECFFEHKDAGALACAIFDTDHLQDPRDILLPLLLFITLFLVQR
ncbi:BQ5605_C061g12737 [Microbotryum silenes-dioicae]|uniref:BQ5605_C061g12737 protein n=1 Tax=Microbotryum silenes-dioicae TaxID=796604 RepID=A0A2X0MUE1_9BASI|nr:BQ5605_C061g12737 [Microbotryum silenes-dioicae]